MAVFDSVKFSHPWLLLLALLPIAAFLLAFVRERRKTSAVIFSAYDWLPGSKRNASWAAQTVSGLHLLALLCLVPIIAGIGSQSSFLEARAHPSALMIVLDVSSSMTAEDFQPENRLQAAKIDLKEFISGNPELELGLVVFASIPRLLVPITANHSAVMRAVDGIRSAEFGEDGTAIGSGIASAINRLRRGTWATRQILLITDGVNNRGTVSPRDAAQLARGLGVKIHAIGIGSDSVSRYWVPSAKGTPIELLARLEIDDKSLEGLALESSGSYRRVKNSEELRRALLSLRLGSSGPFSTRSLANDLRWGQLLAGGALLLLVVEFLLAQVVFSELPR